MNPIVPTSGSDNEEFAASHRADSTPFELVQAGNRTWWTDNTMSYDWNDKITKERFSLPWYEEMDQRFIHSARLYATRVHPFDRLIPFGNLHDREVLEIGCGMGLHTELMTRAGARVTALDLSPTSVEATSRRLALKGLSANVRQGDAENLSFLDKQFDFIWSWGVIHHSSRTAKIVREIARVVRPHGECRIMVYNRDGMSARLAYVRDHILRCGFLSGSFDQTLHRSTDGFSARHYVKDQFEDLFRAFFHEVSCDVCGQESDAIPFPGFVRSLALRFVSEAWLCRRQAQRGSFLFLRAGKSY